MQFSLEKGFFKMQDSRLRFSGFLRHSELLDPKPNTPTSTLPSRFLIDLDKRFFPSGIETGQIIEIKGPENCGKTYLLAHLITQFLLEYTDRKAILIDTSQHFKVRIVVKNLLRAINGYVLEDSTKLAEVLASCPVLNSYLDRLLIVKCYSADELMGTIGIGPDSVLHHMIQNDQDIALICCDTIDNFSFSESLAPTEEFDVILKLVNCFGTKKLPVICTTIMDSDVYGKARIKKKDLSKSNEKTTTEAEALKRDSVPDVLSNIFVSPKYFTHDLTLAPASQTRIREMKENNTFKSGFHGNAYLRSKHKANIAGSVVNHRVKFSILSDIFHVDEG